MPAAPGPGCQPCVLGEKGTLQRWGSPGVPPPAAGFPPPAAGTGWFLLHSSFSEQLPAGQAPPAWHWLCQSWGELRPAGTGFHWVSALQPCPASSAQADAQGLELAALAKNVLQCEQRPLQGPAVSPAAPSVRGQSWPGQAQGAAAVLVLPVPWEVLVAPAMLRGRACANNVWGRLILAPGMDGRTDRGAPGRSQAACTCLEMLQGLHSSSTARLQVWLQLVFISSAIGSPACLQFQFGCGPSWFPSPAMTACAC
ncbi:uncharacterized protein LOC141922333 isoform X1 [Strix aluco]|uniref:uncharacterized protein LOC141922333 isoform X1 n=1 Tax=Strix aluco TaxID=111821 RepID=UPI003DA2CA54